MSFKQFIYALFIIFSFNAIANNSDDLNYIQQNKEIIQKNSLGFECVNESGWLTDATLLYSQLYEKTSHLPTNAGYWSQKVYRDCTNPDEHLIKWDFLPIPKGKELDMHIAIVNELQNNQLFCSFNELTLRTNNLLNFVNVDLNMVKGLNDYSNLYINIFESYMNLRNQFIANEISRDLFKGSKDEESLYYLLRGYSASNLANKTLPLVPYLEKAGYIESFALKRCSTKRTDLNVTAKL